MNQSNFTYNKLTLNATICSILLDFSFTGKERDEETGYSYFGARYYDADLLTGWLGVDPMSDKYPSVSPYNYCAWNPILLVDPNGKIIDTTSMLQEIKNMTNPNHQNYNEAFSNIISELANDNRAIYSFKYRLPQLKDNGAFSVGSLTCQGKGNLDLALITIEYSYGIQDNGEIQWFFTDRFLLEETYHAKQFLDGKFGFYKRGKDWVAFAIDMEDEFEAHKFAFDNMKCSNRTLPFYESAVRGEMLCNKSDESLRGLIHLLYGSLPQSSINADDYLRRLSQLERKIYLPNETNDGFIYKIK